MSKMTRLFGSAIFAVILLLGAGTIPAQASSLTQPQISSILSLLSAFGADSATIASVNTALNGGTPTTSDGGASFCYNFNSDLSVGSSDFTSERANVDALATILQKEIPSFTGDKGATNIFTENVAAAVVKFQAKYGINQTGYVGPITRAKLNNLYGCHSGEQVPVSDLVPVITSTDSTGMVTPGVNVVVNGRNFDSGSYIKLDNAQLITPYYTSYTSLAFTLPSNIAVGSHTIQVLEKASNLVSNSVTLNVVTRTSILLSVPTISTITPSQGTVNSTATIYGNDLTAGGHPTIEFHLMNGTPVGVVSFINMNYISSQAITFDLNATNATAESASSVTLPPGTYQVDISTPNGRSNSVTFTITSTTPTASIPVISGGSGPVSLQIGQSGRWTINASDPNAVSGMLGYSVVWGDETNVGMAASATATTQQTTSFTHSYSQAGTYNPTFTVITSSGGSAKTSMSVVVK
jgi:peptidoglycan hydrolase-like protein with peptidoglycan-binding domain